MRKSVYFIILFIFVLITAQRIASADSVWTDVNVPHPSSIAQDTSGILYATASIGLHKSFDGGDTWIQMTEDPDFFGGFSIVVNPITNDVFAATEPGVYRSKDGGNTWQILSVDIIGTYVLRARSDGMLIASGSGGFWSSIDNGDSWNKISSSFTSFFNGIAFNSSGAIFITTTNGVERTLDDGLTWDTLSFIFSDTDQIMDIAIDPVHDYIYVTGFHQFFKQETYNRIFRSTDNGDSWVLVDSVFGISMSVGVDGAGNVYTGRIPTAYSTDYGENWIDISSGINQGDRLLAFHEVTAGKILLADTDSNMKLAYLGPQPPCCIGIRGNIDNDLMDIIDISDIVYLVDFMFTAGPEPVCLEESNVDGDTGDLLDISDLVYLVDFMFTSGPPPSSCP